MYSLSTLFLELFCPARGNEERNRETMEYGSSGFGRVGILYF